MAIKGYNESTLANSSIFKDLITLTGNDQRMKAMEVIKRPSTRHLKPEDVEIALMSVRQYNNSLTRQALNQFDDGNTILVYNEDRSDYVSAALPFITFKVGSDYKTYVFVNQHITKNAREGTLNFKNIPVFHDLLVSAWVSRMLRINYDKLVLNPSMLKITMTVYARLVVHVLNRKHSIKADKKTLDTLNYWISRFFLINVFKSSDIDENIEINARKTIRDLDDLIIQDIKTKYDQSNPSTITDLLELLKEASPERMKSLNLSSFIQSWIETYHPVSMLAIDTMEYLIFMMISVKNSNGLIAMGSRDLVTEVPNINKFQEELLKLI